MPMPTFHDFFRCVTTKVIACRHWHAIIQSQSPRDVGNNSIKHSTHPGRLKPAISLYTCWLKKMLSRVQRKYFSKQSLSSADLDSALRVCRVGHEMNYSRTQSNWREHSQMIREATLSNQTYVTIFEPQRTL